MAVADKWLDAQYSVLGSMLISPETVPMVISQTGESDYQGECLTVFKTIRKLFLAGTPVDVVSVSNALGSGYRQFLVQLMDITPTAANLETYLQICRDQSRVCALQDLAQTMATTESIDKLRGAVEQASKIASNRPGLKITTMEDALKSFFARHTGDAKYLTWPVPELNDRLYAELGDMIVIGGYPSAGKTAWAMQCAWHWSQEYKVGFFSLETSSEKLFDRQMASVAQISMDAIKRNSLQTSDWDNVCAMTKSITEHQLELIPSGGMSPEDVRAITVMRGYQIIFVDYLQLLQCSGGSRTEQVTQISIALHTMARSLGVTVVALSQLARQDKQSKNEPPDMSSLRESGQIEQDADIIMMLSLRDRDDPAGDRDMRIRKNKEGTCPSIQLAFDGKHQTFAKSRGGAALAAQMSAQGKKIRQANRQKSQMQQMTMLPGETPVPWPE